MKALSSVFALLAVYSLVTFSMPSFAGAGAEEEPAAESAAPVKKIKKKSAKAKVTAKKASKEKAFPAGLKIEDVKVGSGEEAVAGKRVTVHYTGTLTNGKKFDSSRDHNVPFSFHLGAGEVIKGWDEGVAGMKVGGVRKLSIPPELGYGAREVGGGLIPANSTLLFEVELLKVE